jgi:hypothetical protein
MAQRSRDAAQLEEQSSTSIWADLLVPVANRWRGSVRVLAWSICGLSIGGVSLGILALFELRSLRSCNPCASVPSLSLALSLPLSPSLPLPRPLAPLLLRSLPCPPSLLLSLSLSFSFPLPPSLFVLSSSLPPLGLAAAHFSVAAARRFFLFFFQ